MVRREKKVGNEKSFRVENWYIVFIMHGCVAYLPIYTQNAQSVFCLLYACVIIFPGEPFFVFYSLLAHMHFSYCVMLYVHTYIAGMAFLYSYVHITYMLCVDKYIYTAYAVENVRKKIFLPENVFDL